MILGAIAAAALTLAACGNNVKVPAGSVASVDGNGVSKTEFDHWLAVINKSQSSTSTQKQVQKPPKPGSQRYNQLRDQVMQFLLSARWIVGEAGDRGITASDSEVQSQFKQTRDQSFQNTAAYRRFLKQSGQSQQDILYRVRLDVLSNKLRQKITADSGTVSDDEVKSYYAKNKQQFSQPERRQVELVQTRTADKAQEALKRIKGGEPFKKVAKQLSVDPASKDQGGKLQVIKGQQEKTLDDAYFGANKGELKGPVKTAAGYYVFRVSGSTPATTQPFEQAKEGIRQLLLSQKQQQSLDAFTQTFRRKWREKTGCAKGFVTPDCSNGVERPTGSLLGGGGGAQPPAKQGTGQAPALSGGAPAATPTPQVPGAPGGATQGGGAPALSGTGTPPALGGSPSPATGTPQGVPQQVPQQAPPSG